MLFWMICAAIALCVTGLLALAVWRGGRAVRPSAQFDLQVYRDQLSEVDRDAAHLDPDYVTLVEKLREAVANRPGDLQGAELLARHEMALGNAVAAYRAQSQVIRLKGEQASAEDIARYADMLVIAAGGYVSPEAEGAVAAALEADPANGVARYYSGLLAAQIGRPDISFRTWARLLNDSPPSASWVPAVREQIEDMAFRAGVDYALAPLPETRGPTDDDVRAASEMSEEDRMEMVRGMVGNLSDRLATEGGPVEDWARLISSLVVLGDGDGALLVYDDAKRVFESDPNAIRLRRSNAANSALMPPAFWSCARGVR